MLNGGECRHRSWYQVKQKLVSTIEYRPSCNAAEEFTIIDDPIEIYVSVTKIIDLLGVLVIIKTNGRIIKSIHKHDPTKY
jgi:hypothetical protein